MAGRVVNPTPFQSENQQHVTALISFTGATTWKISPGKGFKIKLLYGRIEIVTDATVADRKLHASIQDLNSNKLIQGMACATHTASLTKAYDYTSQGGLITDENGEQAYDFSNMCFPHNIIYETDKLVFGITAGVAGDIVTGYLKYLKVPVNRRFNE